MEQTTLDVLDPQWWSDRPTWIVGGGPSLRGRDLTKLRERGRVLCVNRSAELVPCDAVFSMDQRYAVKRASSLEGWADSGIEVFLAVSSDWFTRNEPIPGVKYLTLEQGYGVGRDPGTIINGLNSGYGALCLAVLKRAREIYLLGYDLHGGNDHWHGGYPWDSANRTDIYFPRWAEKFREIADDLPHGVRVWNCNPNSAVRAFPTKSYDEAGIPC